MKKLVEMAGVEPASPDMSIVTSTRLASHLDVNDLIIHFNDQSDKSTFDHLSRFYFLLVKTLKKLSSFLPASLTARPLSRCG